MAKPTSLLLRPKRSNAMRLYHRKIHLRDRHRQFRRGGIAAVAASVVSLGFIGFAIPALASSGGMLFVSPSGSISNSDASCATAGYSTIQSALDAATPGTTVQVCAGTYAEQVSVGVSGITINGAGAGNTIVNPSSATPTTVTDLDTSATIVPIIDVTGQTGVTIRNITVEGSGLSANFTGCSDNFVGVLYQNATGTVEDTTVDGVELPPSLFGCQDGLGIFAQSSSSSTSLTLTHSTVTSYDKAGVVCVDNSTTCDVTHNTITGAGPSTTGQNGVQIGPGAPGSVVDHNTISGNDYTGTTNSTEPQADYAAGILLYGATGTVGVNQNTLVNNQIGVETVATNATINQNSLSQTSGIDNSVGIFAVACDFYCSYFGLDGNTNVNDTIVQNQI